MHSAIFPWMILLKGFCGKSHIQSACNTVAKEFHTWLSESRYKTKNVPSYYERIFISCSKIKIIVVYFNFFSIYLYNDDNNNYSFYYHDTSINNAIPTEKNTTTTYYIIILVFIINNKI